MPKRRRFPESDLFVVPHSEEHRAERRAALIHQWERAEEKRLIEMERIEAAALSEREPNADTNYGALLDQLQATLVPDRDAARWIALKRLWMMLHSDQWKADQGEMPADLWTEMQALRERITVA